MDLKVSIVARLQGHRTCRVFIERRLEGTGVSSENTGVSERLVDIHPMQIVVVRPTPQSSISPNDIEIRVDQR